MGDVGAAFDTGDMGHHLLITLLEWSIGFSLAAVVGVPVGMIAARSRLFGNMAESWMILLLVVPMVALVPLFILWLGIGVEMKILISFLTALPPVALNVTEGVRAIPREVLAVAESFRASRARLFLSVLTPASLASTLAGLRIGAGQALVGVIFAEMVASSEGVGYAIRTAGSTFNTPRLMLGLVLLAVLAMAVGKSLETAERRLERWRV